LVEGVVGLAVAAPVEAVTDGLARGRLERGDTAEVSEGGLAAEPLRVLAGSDEQLGGDVVADTVHRQQPGRAAVHDGRITA